MAALNPLARWQRRGVWASIGLLAASGWIWLVEHYAFGAGAGNLPQPLEAWMLRLHGALVIAALFMFGAVASLHVPRGWRLGRQKRSGVAMLAGLGLLAATGYGLYYFAPDGVREPLGLVHAVLGTAFAGLLLWHGRAQ